MTFQDEKETDLFGFRQVNETPPVQSGPLIDRSATRTLNQEDLEKTRKEEEELRARIEALKGADLGSLTLEDLGGRGTPPTTPERLQGLLSGLLEGSGGMLGTTAITGAQAVTDASMSAGARMAGEPGGGELARRTLAPAFDEAREAVRGATGALAPTNPKAREAFFGGGLGQAAGSTVAFASAGLLGGLPAVALAGAAVNAATLYEEARAHGASDAASWKAALMGAGVGTGEALPIAHIFARWNRATGGVISKALRSTVGAGEEAVQETLNAVGNNIIAKEIYDPEREVMQDVISSMQTGAGAGFLLEFLGSALVGRRRARSSTSESRQPEPERAGSQQEEAGAEQEGAQAQSGAPETIDRPRTAWTAAAKNAEAFLQAEQTEGEVILEPETPLQGWAREYAEEHGREVAFVKAEGLSHPAALVGDTVVLDASISEEEQVKGLVFHEIFHGLEEETRQQAVQELQLVAPTLMEFVQGQVEQSRSKREPGKEQEPGEIREEAAATTTQYLVGTLEALHQNPNLASELSQASPSLFRRLMEWVQDTLARMGLGTSPAVKRVQAWLQEHGRTRLEAEVARSPERAQEALQAGQILFEALEAGRGEILKQTAPATVGFSEDVARRAAEGEFAGTTADARFEEPRPEPFRPTKTLPEPRGDVERAGPPAPTAPEPQGETAFSGTQEKRQRQKINRLEAKIARIQGELVSEVIPDSRRQELEDRLRNTQNRLFAAQRSLPKRPLQAQDVQRRATPSSAEAIVEEAESLAPEDIRFAELLPQLRRPPQSPAALREVGDTDLFPHFSFSSPGFTQTLDRLAFNRFQRWERVIKETKEQGGNVRASLDPNQAQILFDSRVEQKITREEHRHAEPIFKHMRENGVEREDLDLYLWARHAPDRNQVGVNRDPKSFNTTDKPFSGMPDQRAAEILRDFQARENIKGFEKAAQMFDGLNARRLDLARQYGFITQETIDGWQETFGDTYVPLRGFEFEEEARMSTGKGFSQTKRNISERAQGRASAPESPAIYSLDQFREVIVRGEKNRVGQRALRFIRENPDASNWTETPTPFDEERGQLQEDVAKAKKAGESTEALEQALQRLEGRGPQDPQFRLDEERAIVVWEQGEPRVIHFADRLLGRAMKRMGPEQMNVIVKWAGGAMRYLSSVITMYNPEFMVSNFLRDVQTAGINMSGETSKKLAAATVNPKNLVKSMKAIRRVQKDPDATGEFEDAYRQATAAGAKVGWFHQPAFDKRLQDIDAALRDPNRIKEGFRHLADFVKDWNTVVENAVRLAAYKQARSGGLSISQAAQLYKGLTVNFNRKGELGSVINSAYLFYNASAQGTIRMAQALGKSPTVRKMAAGIAAFGFLRDHVNRMIAGDDDDGENHYDKVPDYLKERYMIFMLPGTDGKRVQFPLLYGYSFFDTIGTQASALASGENDVPTALDSTLKAALGNFAPMGSEDSLWQFVSPTLVDPFVQWVENETFYGAPIRKEQPQFGPEVPESTLYFSSVSPPARWLTEKMNEWSGGDVVVPGWADVNPEALDHAFEFATGGVGKLLTRTSRVAKDVASAEPLEIRQVPFLRQVFGEPDPSYVERTFYDNLEQIEVARARVKLYTEKGDIPRARALAGDYQELLKLHDLGREARNAVRKLNNAADQAGGEAEQRLLQEAGRIQSAFNKRFGEAKENP